MAADSGPQFCYCTGDLTSGVLTGTVDAIDLSALINTSAPLPLLELDGSNGPVDAVAGCQGAGIPCGLLPTSAPIPYYGSFSYEGGPLQTALLYNYGYTVVDQNRNTVAGGIVTEWYQDANAPGSSWTNESTWSPSLSFGPGTVSGTSGSVFGTFTDSVGVGPGGASFVFNQMFTVQMGGTNYLLTTEIRQSASYLSANVTIRTP